MEKLVSYWLCSPQCLCLVTPAAPPGRRSEWHSVPVISVAQWSLSRMRGDQCHQFCSLITPPPTHTHTHNNTHSSILHSFLISTRGLSLQSLLLRARVLCVTRTRRWVSLSSVMQRDPVHDADLIFLLHFCARFLNFAPTAVAH